MPNLAIHGGAPAKSKPFPVWPIYDDRERDALIEVLESRVWWRSPGTQTLAFEREFAAYHQAKHGIAVTNGTHAIEVALAALGIGPGDEVIAPNATFVATASAVLFAGALPVGGGNSKPYPSSSFCASAGTSGARVDSDTSMLASRFHSLCR